MPQQPPNPDTPKRTKTVDSLVRAEKLTQIAFILPAAVVVGWLGGAGLDKWLHTNWIYPVSYTHLDVYKRQALRFTCDSDLPSRRDRAVLPRRK